MTDRSIVMIGASGAVGGHCVRALLADPRLTRLTLLGRRIDPALTDPRVSQHVVDLTDAQALGPLLPGHDSAICTLGVGEPSKVSAAEFRTVDHDMPVLFAQGCHAAGVTRFALLSAVGVSSRSRFLFVRTKGELEDTLRGLNFAALVLAHPSMILTPTNRYGPMQAVVLAVWPWLNPLLAGPLRRYRGIKVDRLGTAIARATLGEQTGEQVMEWDALIAASAPARTQ